jgi:hypothetical protein
MQNDNFFERIKDKIQQDDTNLNQRKDVVWKTIHQRTHSKRRYAAVWWWAAASVVLTLGVLWTANQQKIKPLLAQKTIKDVPKTIVLGVNNSNSNSTKLNEHSWVIGNLKRKSVFQKSKKPIAIDMKQNAMVITEIQTTDTPKTEPDTLIAMIDSKIAIFSNNQTNISHDTTTTPTPKPHSERVMVVDLVWEESASAQATQTIAENTFASRWNAQVTRFKTERKFDIKGLDKEPGNGLWSFIAQSFVTSSLSNSKQ